MALFAMTLIISSLGGAATTCPSMHEVPNMAHSCTANGAVNAAQNFVDDSFGCGTGDEGSQRSCYRAGQWQASQWFVSGSGPRDTWHAGRRRQETANASITTQK